MGMLGTVGSIASLAGLVVSLLGLGFAILQLRKLRGETRAAKSAAQRAEQAVRRDWTNTESARLNVKIEQLKDTHRTGDRSRALSQYADIVESLLDVARRYPDLPDSVEREIFQGIEQIQAMESETEVMEFGIPLSAARSFNRTLSAMQRELLPKLEIRSDGLG